MATKTKPAKLGVVWAATARIQVIDETPAVPVWKTLATCVDTPNAIAAAVAALRRKGVKNIWSVGTVSDRKLHG